MTKDSRTLIQRVHPSAFLLSAQLLLLVMYAVFDGLQIEPAVIGVFGVLVLVLRVWVIWHSPGGNWLAWLLAISALSLSILSSFLSNPALLVWTSIIEAIFYFYTAFSLVAYMMADSQVTTDEWFAAGATFTLLAWGFAYLFQSAQIVFPGSLVSTAGEAHVFSFVELLSLSFSNLSATGLSDIYPTSTLARVLMMLEQFAGVGYIAIVISRLVSMTMSKNAK